MAFATSLYSIDCFDSVGYCDLSDASKTSQKGQIVIITSIMLFELATGAVFNVITWFSRRTKLPFNFYRTIRNKRCC